MARRASALETQMHARIGAGSARVSLALGWDLGSDTESLAPGSYNARLKQRNYPLLRLVAVNFPGTHGEDWTPILDAALRELLP